MQIQISRPLLFAHNLLGIEIQGFEDFLITHSLVPVTGLKDKPVSFHWTPAIYTALLQTGSKWAPSILKCPLFPAFPLSRTKLAGPGLDLKLAGASLPGAELAYGSVTLEGCLAAGVKLVGGDIRLSAVQGHHARLSGCNVVNLECSDLDNINMSECTLSGEWSNCDLANAEMRTRLEDDLKVRSCNLAGATLRLRGRAGTLVTFKRCNLARARILAFEGVYVAFKDCRIHYTRLSGVGQDPPGYRRNTSFLLVPLGDAGSSSTRGTESGPGERSTLPANFAPNAPDHWSEGL